MGEVIFIALCLSAPLWIIASELAEVNRHLEEMHYEDEEDE